MKSLKKHSIFYAWLFPGLLAIMLSCTGEKEQRTPKDLSAESIIPIPVAITPTNSSFLLTAESGILLDGDQEILTKAAQPLTELLRPSTGYELPVAPLGESIPGGSIILSMPGKDDSLGEEGYELSISEDQVKVTANGLAGIYYGIQTLRQLLPAKVELSVAQEGPWEIATGTIRDFPDMEYRGAMLDVARHFFSVEDVKHYIDLLSLYKMNYLHLHLSDDQGWRIEIKSWPNLTTHGGSLEVGGGEGGFYTQEQYKGLVQYAMERNITIVPEIDMPGHTNAALSSYAELNCDGKATELYTGTEVGFSTLCTASEVTYKFIEDVVREVSEITPGPYFHMGGDESHVTPMEDYIPFVNKVQEIVAAHGKKVLGWDEIAHAELKPNTFVQFWDNVKNTTNGMNQGAKVLFSPAKKIYLDMQYDSTTKLGLHWAAYIEIDSAYIWDPLALVPGIRKENILGVEAPLWTETITNIDELEYMVFPRLLGVAEIGWSPLEKRNWEDYKVRLGKQSTRLKALNVDYYPSTLVPWVE
ncbi:MAG: beta-N-acetylhexosaminidase [Cyclobacteriaceae bacterium]|nr:beta-N-acetylhexosaminidase [Cyclobacteriaceae bacterium]